MCRPEEQIQYKNSNELTSIYYSYLTTTNDVDADVKLKEPTTNYDDDSNKNNNKMITK